MKWMVPPSELGVDQTGAIRTISEDIFSDHLVTGFAGTGKTIVLTYVLEKLASLPGRRTICFATYTHALKDLVESGLTPGARQRIDILTFDALRHVKKPYDILVADELQDVSGRYFDAFRRSYKTLIAAADFDQRIYRQAASQSAITEVLEDSVEHELQTCRRLHKNIFNVATSFYPARPPERVKDEVAAEKTVLYYGTSRRDEYSTIFEEAVRQANPQDPSAILFPSKKLMADFIGIVAGLQQWGTPPALETTDREDDKYGPMNRYLGRYKSPLQVFGSGSGEMAASDRRAIVYLMTYHSAKGLDFPYVFLPHLTHDTKLDPMGGSKDDDERRLFFVAATRAKRRLFLSYHGDGHRFLDEINRSLLDSFKKPKRAY